MTLKITDMTRFFTLITVCFLFLQGYAQKKALVTETHTVAGNCGMCRKLIVSAASIKGVRSADWHEQDKTLTITFYPGVTSAESVLRSVAYAGFDNSGYLAPGPAYGKLKDCCKYERREVQSLPDAQHPHQTSTPPVETGHQNHQQDSQNTIKEVYAKYFQIKDALIASDGKSSARLAGDFLKAVEGVNMSLFTKKEHDVYMKYLEEIKRSAGSIYDNKDIERQRQAFSVLSDKLYEIMKTIKPGYTVYLDNCPMYKDGKGANWISREKPIKNPYYGSKMLTCGNITETLK